MCGVFAYVGNQDAVKQVINGLKNLEYRGYDSWGVAVLGDGKIEVYKNIGAIGEQEQSDILPETSVALGHTRWATHGAVNINNCHPHLSSDFSFSVVQNGVVENYQSLKKQLLTKGHQFHTETDTEVIVRLIEDYQQNLKIAQTIDNQFILRDAVRLAFLDLKGRNTLLVLDQTHHQIIGICHGSPLVIGKGDQEYFFASDSLSFAKETNQCTHLEDLEMVLYNNGELYVYDLYSQDERQVEWHHVHHEETEIGKEGYSHYMIKEIMEQWHTIANAADIQEDELKDLTKALKQAQHVFIVGAGGAYFVADQFSYLLRTINQIDAISVQAYELDSYLPLMKSNDVVIAISQSGETADTLEFLRKAKEKEAKIGSVVNMPSSSIARLSDFSFLSRSGPEICVLSTKSCSAQLTFAFLVSQTLANHYQLARQAIDELSQNLSQYLSYSTLEQYSETAKTIFQKPHLFVLGTGQYYLTAKITALNIKEASYIHAEAFSAGEMKHGVFALIEEGTPIIVFMDQTNQNYMINVTTELKSRGAYIIGISDTRQSLFDDFIELPSTSPASIISSVIPGQLLAYHFAILRGHNPDRPRNLAKSVTVI